MYAKKDNAVVCMQGYLPFVFIPFPIQTPTHTIKSVSMEKIRPQSKPVLVACHQVTVSVKCSLYKTRKAQVGERRIERLKTKHKI
jgi:hypothetical protein